VSGDWRGMVSNALSQEELAKAQKIAADRLAGRPAGALDKIK